MTAKRWTVLISSLSVSAAFAVGGLRADSVPACVANGRVVSLQELAGSAKEGSVVAAASGFLVSVSSSGESLVAPTHAAPGVTRHVASKEGGIAYVVDRPGDDVLKVLDSGRSAMVEPGGEVFHPAWGPNGILAYSVDLERIEVLDRDGTRRVVGAPPGTIGVFSPVFDGAGNLLVVAQEPVAGLEAHDDALNNIYRSLPGGLWARLTDFAADADRWSIVRTPVTDAGRVLFVRQTGVASETAAPRFELWELGAAGAQHVRNLTGEAYLATVGDPGILWNVERHGEWRLVLESPEGFQDLGCGGVMVDPRNETDPDRAPEIVVPRAGKEDVSSMELGPGMGIVVGDFATRSQAQLVVGGIGQGAKVLDNDSAPLAVADGVFAVGIPLPATSDGLAELDALRDRFPEYGDRSWISWIGDVST